MNIGLLLISGEDDILERTLAANCEFVDAFYVLDGTTPNTESEAICRAHPKCAGYITDAQVGGHVRDGARQYLYELAAAEHGRDHWFLILHGDEVWTGLPDNLDDHDGLIFRLPFYFPRVEDGWDYDVHPLDQLKWNLAPGWPEFRMFRGGADVNFDPAQHFNVTPSGVKNIGGCDKPIRHYLYRSPADQRARAARHVETGFDPDNYRHILDDDAVLWTDEMTTGYQSNEHFRELVCDA